MNDDRARWITPGQAAALAILREATAPKPGNVHRGADFEDMTYEDIVTGGIAIIPAIDRTASDRQTSLGTVVLDAVARTRQLVGRNTNLGTILLIAPLAKAALPPEDSFAPAGMSVDNGYAPAELSAACANITPVWRVRLQQCLQSMNAKDAEQTYAAIRLAQPGGLGTADEHDVAQDAPSDLLTAMRAAAERDLVAAQYANGFEQVFDLLVPKLANALPNCPRNDAIVRVYLELMAEFPDSLIARKCGEEVARQSADRAAHVLASGNVGDTSYHHALADFDFWLRSDGHRRNPGTSADLIAAALFCVIMIRAGLVRTT